MRQDVALHLMGTGEADVSWSPIVLREICISEPAKNSGNAGKLRLRVVDNTWTAFWMIWTYPPNSLQWFCLRRVLHPALLNAAFLRFSPTGFSHWNHANQQGAGHASNFKSYRSTNRISRISASIPMCSHVSSAVSDVWPKCHHIFPKVSPYIPIYSHIFPCIPMYSHLFPFIPNHCFTMWFHHWFSPVPLDASCSTSSSPDRTARLSVARSDSPVGSGATRCLSLDNSPRRPCKGWESNGKLGKQRENMKQTWKKHKRSSKFENERLRSTAQSLAKSCWELCSTKRSIISNI